MGRDKRAGRRRLSYGLALTALLALPTLAGCTATAPPVPETFISNASSTAGPTESTAETAESVLKARIFALQLKSLDTELPTESKVILTQSSGTGTITVGVASLPTGQRRLGATVTCSGNGPWKIKLDSSEDTWASGTCSMDGGGNYIFPVNKPQESHILSVEVSPNTSVWVTTFATKS